MAKHRITNERDILHHFDDYVMFTPDDTGVIPVPTTFSPGKSRLVVVVGPNANGKSIVRLVVGRIVKGAGIEYIPISMEARTGSMMGAASAFVYGDESWQATGALSANTVLTGIKACRSREGRHVIFWDEPDLGLSDEYAAGMGQTLAAFASDLPDKTVAAFVVTHSRALLTELASVKPGYLGVGEDALPTLQAWLDRKVAAKPIEKLGEDSLRRFRLIQKAIDANKVSK